MATVKMKSVQLSKLELNEFSTSTVTLATEAELNAGLQTKADAATTIAGYGITDAYTKTEVDSAISTAVAGAFKFKGTATAISADFTKITVGGSEITAASTNNGHVYQIGEVEYASNGSEWVKLGFTLDLSGYYTSAQVDTKLADKVDKVEGSSLMTTAEHTKLEGIATGAQVNVIDAVNTTDFTIGSGKTLALNDIAMTKITGLGTALDGKVDKVAGHSLVDDDEITKLAGIAAGAQVNVIETVKVNGTALTVTSKAVDITVPTGALASKDEVAESDLASALATKINGKVDAVSGYSLVADTEITKLAGVSTGANKVEASSTNGKIKIDGTDTTVYTLPSDVVQDSNYAHITVTSTSVSDGTTTFNKYDDTALQTAVAGKAAKVTGAITALSTDYSIEDIATAVSALITKVNSMNA